MNVRAKKEEYLEVICLSMPLPETKYLFNDLIENPGLLIPTDDPKESKSSILIEAISSGCLSVADFILRGAVSLRVVPEKTDLNVITPGPKQIVLQRRNNDWEASWLENGMRRRGCLYQLNISDINKDLPLGYREETSFNQALIKKITLRLGCTYLFWQNQAFLHHVDPFFCGNINQQLYGFLKSVIINVYHALVTLEFYQSQNKMSNILIKNAGDVAFFKSHYDLLYWIDADIYNDQREEIKDYSDNIKKKSMSFYADEECGITDEKIERYKNSHTFFFMKLAYRAFCLKNIMNDYSNTSVKDRALAFEALGDFYLHLCYMECYSRKAHDYALNCALEHYVCAKQLRSSYQIDEKIAYTESCIPYQSELFTIQCLIYRDKPYDVKEIDQNATQTQYIVASIGPAVEITENVEDNILRTTRYKKDCISDGDGRDILVSEAYDGKTVFASNDQVSLFHSNGASSNSGDIYAVSCAIS